MRWCPQSTIMLLLLTASTVMLQAQPQRQIPAPYSARGARCYLVNYGAIGGNRFLAEFAGRRFALIDEARAADIPMLRVVDPGIPILRYKDIVALHRHMDEFPALNRDEYAFLHSCEPSGLQILLRGDTATLSWLPDRRDLPITGYRLRWHLDSLDGGQPLGDTLISSPPFTARLPKSAVYISVATQLQDGGLLQYGLPVRRRTQAGGMTESGLLLLPERIAETRTSEFVDVEISVRVDAGTPPDSLFIIGDWNRNNRFDIPDERQRLQHSGERWTVAHRIDIAGLRTHCGYEFRIEAWSSGTARLYPQRGAWHSNINNRLINNTYGFYVMNVGSSMWRQSYIEQVLLAFSQRGYSGLFEDDCWYRVANYGVDAWPPEPYDELRWRTQLFGMMDSIRTGIAPRPAYFNGLHTETSDSLLLHAEGGMTEGFAYTHWSGLVRGASWQRQCNRGLVAQHVYGKTWLALGGAPFDDHNGRLYALASYLLVADSMSLFANATTYQEFAHFPEFDLPLGSPLETADRDVDDLAHQFGGGTLHRREYERGTVVVNAGSEPAVYPDARGRAVLRLEGGTTVEGGRLASAVPTDTLPSGSARIYLNLQPGEQFASPVIDSIRVEPAIVSSDGSTPCSVAVRAHDPSPASLRSDPSLPLSVVLDAGTVGGPRHLQLTAQGSGSPEQPVWFRGAFTLPVGAPPDSASLPVRVHAATGLVTVGRAPIRIRSADSANLLQNYSFEIDNNDDGIPDHWRGYVNGFDYDTSGSNAVTGSRSVHARNDSLSDFRGVSVHIALQQSVPQPLELSGWSKCIDVSGEENNDYALYADIRYTDGTPLYGRTATFSTGTHDWEFSSTVIEPEKPIASISLYALFRRHTGEVWFDQLALRPYQEPSSIAPRRDAALRLSVYPNPADDVLLLHCTSMSTGHAHLQLFDRLGRLCRSFAPRILTQTPETWSVPLDGLPAGLYFLYVRTNDGSIAKPVILR